MATLQDVLDAVGHVKNCTGNPTAWQAGLSPGQLNVVLAPFTAFTATPQQLDAILATIRTRHPALFDPKTGAPLSPPAPAPPGGPPAPQSGPAADAMKNAEADLAHVQTAVAEFDRQMIEAILHAHKTTEDGQRRLAELERDIENTVTTLRLDTPLGAREFQRYLIGKLRDILAVVQEANDDDTSQQALAAAWAALYASQGGTEETGEPPRLPPAEPAHPDDTPAADPDDPIFDTLPADDLGPLDTGVPAPAPAAPPAPPAPPPPAMPMPAFGAPGGGALPAGGLPGALPLPGLQSGTGREPCPKDLDDDVPPLDDLLPDDEPVPEDTLDDETGDAAPEVDPTTVTLPDGETITAASPQLAAAIKAAAEGTPIAEAFRQQGITIPPPGTAVTAPIDPTRVIPGDLGMFTDRHALVVGHSNALLDGQIQRIANVSGPSFLGWQHPPAPATTSTEPATPEPPTPTRPSATVAT